MLVYLVSGTGRAAGKTTLANRIVGPSNVVSIAGAIRKELASKYPDYNWFAKEQEYKDKVTVKEHGNKSIRDVMVEYGQQKCVEDPCYWVRQLCNYLKSQQHCLGCSVVAIDDVRKRCELEMLKALYPRCVHFHVYNPQALEEPQYDNNYLHNVADYVTHWA